MSVDHDQSVDVLPHAPPFRFVSQLTDLRPGASVRGIWHVDGEEDFFRGHFPANPVVPGVLVTEALAQVSGLIVAIEEPSGAPVQGRLAHVDVRFLKEVRPPADIVLNSSLSRSLGALHQFAVEAQVEDDVVARGTVTLALGHGAPLPEVSR